jgi:transposase
MREIINAIFYVLRAACAWRLLPGAAGGQRPQFPALAHGLSLVRPAARGGLFEAINITWSCSIANGRGARPAQWRR